MSAFLCWTSGRAARRALALLHTGAGWTPTHGTWAVTSSVHVGKSPLTVTFPLQTTDTVDRNINPLSRLFRHKKTTCPHQTLTKYYAHLLRRNKSLTQKSPHMNLADTLLGAQPFRHICAGKRQPSRRTVISTRERRYKSIFGRHL